MFPLFDKARLQPIDITNLAVTQCVIAKEPLITIQLYTYRLSYYQYLRSTILSQFNILTATLYWLSQFTLSNTGVG